MYDDIADRIVVSLDAAEARARVRKMHREAALQVVHHAISSDPRGPTGIRVVSAGVSASYEFNAQATALVVAWWEGKAYVEAKRIFALKRPRRQYSERVRPSVAAMLADPDRAHEEALERYAQLVPLVGTELPKPRKGAAWEAIVRARRSRAGYYRLMVTEWAASMCMWYRLGHPRRWCVVEPVAIPCEWPKGEVWSSAHPELAMAARLRKAGLPDQEIRAAVIIAQEEV